MQCSSRCSSTLTALDKDIELDDETFQKLASQTQEIATYLKNNKQQRQHYMQIAMATTDSDKRAFLTDVFMHLPDPQRREIAENFVTSKNWRCLLYTSPSPRDRG